MTPNNRLGTMGVAKLKRLITERDQAILSSIQQHKFLTTRQIYDLHFWTHASYTSGIRACTRVLARLRDHQLIYRLERPVGGLGGGSTSYVWGIDAAGDRLLRAENGETSKRSRSFEPTTMFLQHTLAIAATRLELESLARAARLELLAVTTEPRNWRPFITRSGSPDILKPDLHAVTAIGAYEDHWFIEVDRGTESLPTLLRKCHLYQRYKLSGIEQDKTGVFPIVLWLIPTQARRDRLDEAITADPKLDHRLFRIADPNELETALIQSTNSTKGGTP